MSAHVRAATPDDLQGICALLISAQLPTAGVAEHLESFLVAEQGDAASRDAANHDAASADAASRDVLLATIGMERYGDAALLRSMAVAESARGSGLGTQLVHALEAKAVHHDVRTLVLLTTTAERWFAALGYEYITREDVPDALLDSAEFRGARPASAIVMRKRM